MATLTRNETDWTRRLQNVARTLFAPGDATALVVVVALLLMPLLSLQAAGWPLALNTVLPVTLLGVLFGFLLARSHYNELLALVMSSLYGGAFILLIAAINEPGRLDTGLVSVMSRVSRWMIDAFSGGINQDELVFTLLVATLMWFLSYSAAWHVFRIDRVWRAVLPPGLILVTNSIYYTGEANLDIYLVVFLFMALLLVVRSNLDAREWEWYVNGIRVPRRLHLHFFRLGAALALIALLVAWVIPSADLQDRLDRFQEFLQADPLTQLGEFWNRLFANIDAQGPSTADYYGGDSLQLGGAIQLGDQPVFWVSAAPGRRYYWRSRVFDTYENGRWLPAADTRLTDPQAPLDITYETYVSGSRVAVEQQFTMGLNASRLIYAAPQPLQVDLTTRTDLRYIDANGQWVLPQDDTSAAAAMNVSVIRPSRVLRRGDSYSVTSNLSAATAAQLRQAGTSYPQWVNDLYLYVSPSVTTRTVDLARTIVDEAGAVTPYDQARALETWLRQNIQYNESIPQPPRGRDPVDWLLFDIQEGYCNYYASAMIVMLRTLGVPARLAAGFAQGTWDAERQVYEVLERDAHTWVEVYFPDYGWVEFEPTAAQAPLNRVDDAPQMQQPTPTPVSSPTPTTTPTPSPSLTIDPTVLPPQSEGRTLPTLTPTVTPSPTVTPFIVPTQPPPVPPQQTSGLSFLLPLIGLLIGLLLLFVLLVLLALFLWWWWEWRGMGDFSPVARAYARLERYVALIGIRFTAQQTPDERRNQLVKDLPSAEPPLTAITSMYTSERYGRGTRHPNEKLAQSEIADTAWSETRGNILQRFLRRLLPWNRR